MSTALKKKEEAALPAMMAESFAADAGSGFENADKDSYAIPFIKLLQSMSPQCKKSNGAYIQGAEEGMLFNTVTEEAHESALKEMADLYKAKIVDLEQVMR